MALSPAAPSVPGGALRIPMVDLKRQYQRIKPHIEAVIADVLEDARFVLGPPVAALERRLADYVGCTEVVSTSSGTDALLLPLMAAGIGPGDAVFVPSFTFTATPEAAARVGAEVVFVDVVEDSFHIDPTDLEAKIAEVKGSAHLRAAAVISVDLFGLPVDYDAIAGIVAAHELFWISDGAQAFGAGYGDRRVGSLAPVTATSFFPAKPLGCYGDGGAVFTNDPELANLIRSIRTHGHGGQKFEVVRIGANARLDSVQAAILSVKMDVFDEELSRREEIAAAYDKALSDLAVVPVRVPGRRSAWANYTIKVKGRDALRAALANVGIASSVFYPTPMHLQPAYAKWSNGVGSLPMSEALCAEVLTLPLHPYLLDSEVNDVVAAVRDHLTAAPDAQSVVADAAS